MMWAQWPSLEPQAWMSASILRSSGEAAQQHPPQVLAKHCGSNGIYIKAGEMKTILGALRRHMDRPHQCFGLMMRRNHLSGSGLLLKSIPFKGFRWGTWRLSKSLSFCFWCCYYVAVLLGTLLEIRVSKRFLLKGWENLFLEKGFAKSSL